MTINTSGYHFVCNKCGIIANVNATTDFHHTICNGESIFFIICPICGTITTIPEKAIPKHIKPYISLEEWNANVPLD